MVLSFYRRGTCERGAVREIEGSGCSGRQLLLGFEEDQICVVREIERYGCISGSRPWSGLVRRVWPGSGAPVGRSGGNRSECCPEGFSGGLGEGMDEGLSKGRPEDCA